MPCVCRCTRSRTITDGRYWAGRGRMEDVIWAWGRGGIDLVHGQRDLLSLIDARPSGKSPVLPDVVWRPNNVSHGELGLSEFAYPSPKSSSRSTSSILSPFLRLNSSGLRASKSSTIDMSVALRHGRNAPVWRHSRAVVMQGPTHGRPKVHRQVLLAAASLQGV